MKLYRTGLALARLTAWATPRAGIVAPKEATVAFGLARGPGSPWIGGCACGGWVEEVERDGRIEYFSSEGFFSNFIQSAIRVGKFQQLHRDLNKLQKAVAATPVAPSLLLERVVAILAKYPLTSDAPPAPSVSPAEPASVAGTRLPEIIISESFI